MRCFIAILALAILAVEARAEDRGLDVTATINRGLGFLAKDSVAWKQSKQCYECHHAPFTIDVDKPDVSSLTITSLPTTGLGGSSGSGSQPPAAGGSGSCACGSPPAPVTWTDARSKPCRTSASAALRACASWSKRAMTMCCTAPPAKRM